jgi:hypothetical protein
MRARFFIPLVAVLNLLVSRAGAQRHALNMAEHDEKLYYFGITFGFNYSQYKVHYTESFAQTDTVRRASPTWKPGFNLGLMGNLRVNRFIDLRFVPCLVFAEKGFKYNMAPDSTADRSIESIYMNLPLQLKFKSERIRNFRFYALLGGKFDYDLSSNARSRRPDEWLKVQPIDFGADVGFGFEFYYPNFIFSPELKISQGFKDQHYRDTHINLSNAIDDLHTRMIVFSIHLEG